MLGIISLKIYNNLDIKYPNGNLLLLIPNFNPKVVSNPKVPFFTLSLTFYLNNYKYT